MTVNARWRLIFRFADCDAYAVAIEDYTGDEPRGGRNMARIRTHPGSVLREELRARGMSANQLALAIRVPANRVTAILRGDRAVSAETALRLGRYFGTGPEFWVNLQGRYDVSVVVAERGKLIEQEVPVASVVSAPR